MPVVAGISAADRLVRDRQLGVDELLQSTSLKPGAYLAGKYQGVLGSLLVPVLAFNLLVGAFYITRGAPPIFSLMHLASGTQYRLVGASTAGHPEAVAAVPGLEDGYVWLMKSNGHVVETA
jgi:hypothetical protein